MLICKSRKKFTKYFDGLREMRINWWWNYTKYIKN